MTAAAFDEILKRLVAAGARFVVIGGLALGARGVVRATKDIDIVVAPDPENLKLIAEVAVAAGGHVQRGEALLGTPFSIAAELASGEQMAIETDLGRLDIVQGLDGVPSFEELHSRATEAEVLGVNVAVCSVEDLRAMKEAAGRGQDLVDLENLEAAEGSSGESFVPDTSFEAIRKRLGTEPATSAEFEAEVGPVQPPGGEG